MFEVPSMQTTRFLPFSSWQQVCKLLATLLRYDERGQQTMPEIALGSRPLDDVYGSGKIKRVHRLTFRRCARFRLVRHNE
jgi:hypothetical protein